MRVGERAQRVPRLAVQHAAAGDDQRLLRGLQHVERIGELERVGRRAAHPDQRRREERLGPVVREGLHVLRQRETDGAALRGIGHHLDRARQRDEQLLGRRDAVEVARHGPEAVVRADVALFEILDLLQHGVGQPRHEHVAGQQQQRQAADVRERGRGQHVGRAGADARRRGHHPLAEIRLRERDGRVGHSLFVVRAKRRQPILLRVQRFAEPGHVAVAEDREHAAAVRQDLGAAVGLDDFGAQGGQVAHERLADGQSYGGGHRRSIERSRVVVTNGGIRPRRRGRRPGGRATRRPVARNCRRLRRSAPDRRSGPRTSSATHRPTACGRP